MLNAGIVGNKGQEIEGILGKLAVNCLFQNYLESQMKISYRMNLRMAPQPKLGALNMLN